jgi:cobalt-zinc-cadmium efflux system outer membrane protein
MGCSVFRSARVRAAVYSIAIAGSLQVSVARAEPLPPLAELLRQSQTLAPQLIEGEANLQAAQGLARQAAALPNPVVSYQSENFAGTRDFSRISPVQNTISLSQTLEVGGKRSARIAAETANAAAASAGFEQAQLDFARDLAISYATCEVAASQVKLLEEELTRATEDERAARALVQAGRESDLRSIQARAALTNTQARLEQARASLSESLIRISTLAGVAEQYTDVRPLLLLRADKLALPADQAPVATAALRTAEADRESTARRVDVERRRPISDITVSVGSRRLPGLDATALVAGVSIPIPVFDQNRGAIAAQRSQLRAAEARLSAVRLQLTADWRSAFAQARAAGLRLKASNESEAAAREAYRLSRIGYDAGRTSLLELLSVRRALSEAQLQAVEARFARVQAQITLSHLLGQIPFEDTP